MVPMSMHYLWNFAMMITTKGQVIQLSVQKHYLNLTNGLEWKLFLDNRRIQYSYIRIQSTTLEQHNYAKLFNDLDHDLLFNLAIGNRCFIYDCGTNRLNSKTIYLGVPLIRYILRRYWYRIGSPFRYTRNSKEQIYDCCDSFRNIFDKIDRSVIKEYRDVKNRIKYYKRFINGKDVLLHGISKSTTHDGDYGFYNNIGSYND